ncbi:EAL domain-containing response regulator [Ancylobacter amanitiformis]|uniref:Diguanylate cyclase (GGDEF)-like protein/PAS domain S-box-containing protein n=1 Tax=Ancylobacter amanitiformis TaxID=217069 RepID=A0ABU0LTW4_9HYPH|nr:EAL domain-containing protein [Ancylobacter amanitiformis]MDQ0512153.1 diguanylate cyclase (GGDEF)-like protein/PAS domain S-box-containing protein [Ancylobacter amanitiformis]
MAQELMPTILIIDDSSTNRRIYSRLARQLESNVNVRSFENPAKALDWLTEHTADLIITDYKMPMMSGAALITAIRANSLNQDVPIIVVTAYSDQQYRLTSLEAGATDFLLSPVDHVEFLARARNLLKLRTQQLQLMKRADFLEITLNAKEQLLRESREALAQVIDTVPAMISATDRDGRCVFVNAHQAAFIGKLPGDLVGQPIEVLLGEERAHISRRLDQLVVMTGRAIPSREEEVQAPNGDFRIYLTSKAPLYDGTGDIASVLTTSIDITERRHAEKRLQHIASHDSLTGLPNRMMLRDHLRRELARGRRGDQHFALHFIDLDRFKAINDAHGHHRGDELLQRVARALTGLVGSTHIVARLGGDEFAILQPDIDGPEDAERLAQAILHLLNSDEDSLEALKIGASIGVTLAPLDGTDPDELLKNSDQAMYLAKSLGGGTWRFFAADMRPRASQTAQLQAEMRGALTRREFVMFYQPQIDLRSNKVVGGEALLRWQHPQHGLLMPASFLGLAEESGLIVPINEWALNEACRQGAVWEAEGLGELRIAVNLSPIQFRRQGVESLVKDALRTTGFRPTSLELEVTEGILLGHDEQIVTQMHVLRSLGVTLSVDDFGTGYSSLSYIRRFPLHRLKIDRSFVQDLGNDPSALAIVRTIIDLGHILHLQVLAEGVEEESQLALLRSEGCDEVQGYYFSRPIPADAFATWVRAHERANSDVAESPTESEHAGPG